MGLKFDLLHGTGPDLVVSFTSIGHDPGQVPSFEFLKSAHLQGRRSVLFVTDVERQWGNSQNFGPLIAQAIAIVQGRQRVEKTLFIGQSMGGFNALVAASLIVPTAVLAISPQFSICPEIMPHETRWSEWTSRIALFRVKSAPLEPKAPTILLHGLGDDSEQAQAFPLAPHVDHYLFPQINHSDLAKRLKTLSLLPAMIDCALTGDRRRMGRLIASAAGFRRKSDQLPR